MPHPNAETAASVVLANRLCTIDGLGQTWKRAALLTLMERAAEWAVEHVEDYENAEGALIRNVEFWDDFALAMREEVIP